jgi:hypothetical protein
VHDDCPADGLDPDDTSCDDGDLCTRSDTCQAGTCTGADPVVCTALDQCHQVGTCNASTGLCSDPPAPNGSSCNDNDACTQTDECQSGVCTGLDPIVCSGPESCYGTCNPANGECTGDPKPNGTPCTDGSACTQTDACSSGLCVGGDPVVCTPLDNCHLLGTCDPQSGVCSQPLKPNGASCDDGNVCTLADSCTAGTCQGLEMMNCCLTDSDCNDGRACTEDRCVEHDCMHLPFDDRCGGGAECNVAVCGPQDPNADADGCVLRPADENAYCTEDANPCTTDACRDGTCRHEDDRSGPRCGTLAKPFKKATELLTQASQLTAFVQTTGLVVACRMGEGVCNASRSGSGQRLVDLLEAAQTDLRATLLTLGGRLTGSTTTEPGPDPTMRARVALTLLVGTPGDMRGFLATLAQMKKRREVTPQFARARRAEGRRLLRGTNSLRGQLRRLTTTRGSFTP